MEDMEAKFRQEAMTEENPRWEKGIERKERLYHRQNDIRSEFARDYTRILHCLSYRRLKHKTQVFFNVHNDHICTRMEHVLHVESVSGTIGKALGLNTDLIRAIAMGHDLGHAPFGHSGEQIISKLCEEYLEEKFWHEKNGVYVVDKLDLLDSPQDRYKNLNLTYAVRDGIISHCGEVDENGLKPREEALDLCEIKRAGQYNAYTWEGCVVKLADKIAYLGRDIEDAIKLHVLSKKDLNPLLRAAKSYGHETLNTSVIMHEFVTDLIMHSSPENGIGFSTDKVEFMQEIKNFNYEHIYKNKKLSAFVKYSELVLQTIFEYLMEYYDDKKTLDSLSRHSADNQVLLDFHNWVIKFVDPDCVPTEAYYLQARYDNEKIYGRMEEKSTYVRAVIDFISGMTDAYAIQCFENIITF